MTCKRADTGHAQGKKKLDRPSAHRRQLERGSVRVHRRDSTVAGAGHDGEAYDSGDDCRAYGDRIGVGHL